jgi:hypothetical protein
MKPRVYVETTVLGYLTSWPSRDLVVAGRQKINYWSRKAMVDDPIVEEIRRARHAHASQFNNDLAAIVADLRRLERESGRSHVSFPPRSLEKQAAQAPQDRSDDGRNGP